MNIKMKFKMGDKVKTIMKVAECTCGSKSSKVSFVVDSITIRFTDCFAPRTTYSGFPEQAIALGKVYYDESELKKVK